MKILISLLAIAAFFPTAPSRPPEPARWTPIERVFISPNGGRIVTATESPCEIRSFAMAGGANSSLHLTGLRALEGVVWDLAFGHKRDLIAVSPYGYELLLLSGGDLHVRHRWKIDEEFANLRFTSDDQALLAVTNDLYKWNVLNGQVVYRPKPSTSEGGESRWDTLELLPITRRPLAVTNAPDSKVWQLWDLNDLREPLGTSTLDFSEISSIHEENGSLTGVRIEKEEIPTADPERPDKKTTLHFHNVETGAEIRKLDPYTELCLAITGDASLHVSPNATTIGIRTENRHRLTLFSAKTGAKIKDLEAPGGFVGQNWTFASDRAAVAPCGWKCVFWDLRTGKIALTLIPNLLPQDGKEHPHAQWIAYTPDGTYTGSKDCVAYFGPTKARTNDPAKITALLQNLLSR